MQTKSERRRILIEHRAEMVAKVAELESVLALIDEKLAHFEGMAE